MRLKNIQFTKGYIKGDDSWEKNTPQVCFWGRSNAGKSSSINAIMNHKNLARPSATPGKTQEVNFFYTITKEILSEDGELLREEEGFHTVDLPGYGYAKLSKDKRATLEKMLIWFAHTRAAKRIHILVCDAQLGLTETDIDMLKHILQYNEPLVILLNKSDKVNQKNYHRISNETKKNISEILERKNSQKRNEVEQKISFIKFSAFKKSGVSEFWNKLAELL